MSTVKNAVCRLAILLVLLFCLSGCHLFTEGKRVLNLYCPGLRVDIGGVSYSANGARDFYVLSYDRSFQKQVQTYFAKKENNFTEVKDSDLFDLEMDDEAVIDKTDSIVGKTIDQRKGKAEVVFNQTTRRIIIVEYSEK